jgi:uncharacterized membrane protein YeiH
MFAAIVVGVMATTAGGVLIDLFSGVTPEVVRPAEHVVTTAVLASAVYSLIALQATGMVFSRATLIAVLAAFIFRVLAVREHWKQIVFAAPAAGPGADAEAILRKKVG